MSTPAHFQPDPVHRMTVLGQVAVAADRNSHLLEPDHADGTGGRWADVADLMHNRRLAAFSEGAGSWRHLMLSHAGNVMAAPDQVQLRSELMHLAAVAVRWAEAIDRRDWHDEDPAVPLALADAASAELEMDLAERSAR